MTIDEAIKIIDADALYSPECAKFCKDALEELKWYREKAEPTSSKMERNGDCETCKHYHEQGELTYGFCADCIEKGMGKYEPYIPNSIEKEFIVHNKEDWDRFIADIDKE